jgi:hypothetical protein
MDQIRTFFSKYRGEVVVGILVFLMLILKNLWTD